jgi:RNA polymerase sigma factor (sigma-70 family)
MEDAVAEADVALLRSAELWVDKASSAFGTYAVKAMFNRLFRLARIEQRRVCACNLADTWEVHEDPRQHDPSNVCAEREELQLQMERIADALTKIDPRLREVILARAEGEKPKTVAERFGLSRQRICQIEEQARVRLRKLLGTD